jgi:hypothetical protein
MGVVVEVDEAVDETEAVVLRDYWYFVHVTERASEETLARLLRS